jgi:hypothetical protein
MTFKKTCLLSILLIFVFTIHSFAQNAENVLSLSRISNHKKVKQIAPNSFFKLKTIGGVKIKGKFAGASKNYLTTTENDTILFSDIRWIKAKRELTKLGKGLAIAGVFAGAYFSLATVPAALMIMAMHANYWIILAPVATLSATVAGYKTLKGRRYKMKRWKLETKNTIN